jgi:hypothetical protein
MHQQRTNGSYSWAQYSMPGVSSSDILKQEVEYHKISKETKKEEGEHLEA